MQFFKFYKIQRLKNFEYSSFGYCNAFHKISIKIDEFEILLHFRREIVKIVSSLVQF